MVPLATTTSIIFLKNHGRNMFARGRNAEKITPAIKIFHWDIKYFRSLIKSFIFYFIILKWTKNSIMYLKGAVNKLITVTPRENI